MIWRMVMLSGVIGAGGAAIGASTVGERTWPTSERTWDPTRTVDLRIWNAAEPGVPPWIERQSAWDHLGSPARVADGGPPAEWTPTPTSVIWDDRVVTMGNPCRYRLFRPPDHAGPEFDAAYRSDVAEPGADGTIKLGGDVILQEPLGLAPRKTMHREIATLEGQLLQTERQIRFLGEKIEALELERDLDRGAAADPTAWMPMWSGHVEHPEFSLDGWERAMRAGR